MRGLSSNIEDAVKTVIEGLEYNMELELIDDVKMKSAMKSKIDSFIWAKQLLDKWTNSQNRPSDDKIIYYVEELIRAGDSALKVLKMALSSSIDYDDLDQDKHGTAISAKNTILSAIFELDAGLMELRLQIESENINLSGREFTIGYPEKFANGEFYPVSNYYKEWYDSKNESVKICPKGTSGKKINLEGLSITLPKIPNKKDILFSDLPKKEQYWKREDLPKGLTSISVEAWTSYILEEFRRRREGIWFMNKGEPVYLTGNAYFALQWCKMRDNGGYMDFRYSQLNMFYFAEACMIDDRSLGQLFVKSRRTGFTYIILFIMLNLATSTSNGFFGLTSKSDTDAKKAFIKLSYAFLNLPFFFRPIVKGGEDSHKMLEFAKPSDRSKLAKKQKSTETDGYLNTIIDYQPTNDGSYDGQKMNIYLGDEASKWKKPANYSRHWGRIAPTFDEGGMIVGKAHIGSTVNPMKEGGIEFKELESASRLEKRDSLTNRTPSGLYSYFLGAHDNMTKFTDKYGICHTHKPKVKTYNVAKQLITKGSIEFLEARRESKKRESEIAYNEELRAFPMTKEEAFRDSSEHALFNLTKIYEQIGFNESLIIGKDVLRGNFVWEKGIADSKVEWRPDPKGRFYVTWIPSPELRNRFIIKKGIKYPQNEHIGAFGCDSYDISGAVGGKGSKGALHGMTKMHMENAPTKMFFLEYIARPQKAEIFYEDVLKAIVFYGMPVLVENNKPRLLYHLKNRGYRGFSMNRPDRYSNQLSKSERELGGIPSAGSKGIQDHAGAIESYIVDYVGNGDESSTIDLGSVGNMYFNRTLSDWANFDINNRTEYDASISSGYALMANQKTMYLPEIVKRSIQINIPKFNNKGHISKQM